MATTQSSSPLYPAQRRAKPAPTPTTSLVEQQLRLSVESPQLLAAIDPSSLGQDAAPPLGRTAFEQLRSQRCRDDDERGRGLGHGHRSGRGCAGKDQAIRPRPCPLPPPARDRNQCQDGGAAMSQRVAIYAHVSTLHSQNPEMQLAELREYAARRRWELPPNTSTWV